MVDTRVRKIRKEFNKEFGSLKKLDIVKEYINILFHKSKLTPGTQKKLRDFVALRRVQDKEFDVFINDLHKDISDKLKLIETVEEGSKP